MTDADAQPHVSVSGLKLAFGDFVVQQDLEFAVRRGSVFVIMGPSGCGKTTVLKSMIGLKKPAAGSVLYRCDDGEEVDYWNVDGACQERMRQRFGVLFQSGALWSSMTLAENIGLPLGLYTDLDADGIREVAAYKLALVGLRGFEDYYPSEISGGMRKRAGLARAMALDPELLFFDEPSAGLDPISSRLLDELILELRDSLGTTFVVVTHELASIFTIADDSVFLDAQTHRQIETGDPKRLRDHGDERVRHFLARGEEQPSGDTAA